MVGLMLSLIGNPKSKTFKACSDLVSLISKCKCGPPDPPVFPENAIRSPFFTGIKPESG